MKTTALREASSKLAVANNKLNAIIVDYNKAITACNPGIKASIHVKTEGLDTESLEFWLGWDAGLRWRIGSTDTTYPLLEAPLEIRQAAILHFDRLIAYLTTKIEQETGNINHALTAFEVKR